MVKSTEWITHHEGHIIQVEVQIPLAIKSVNSYLLKDGDNYVWVDPGLNTEEIKLFWKDIFETLHITPTQISKIICTHQHPDHFGLAGFAQQWTGAKVYMSKASIAYAHMLWMEDEQYAKDLTDLFLVHQVPQPLIDAVVDNLQWFKGRVMPFPQVTFFDEATTFNIDGQLWSVFKTSGHADGQMMLWQAQQGLLIGGDQVLPHITPHVGVVPGQSNRFPLQDFLQSLMEIKSIPVVKAFAGHGRVFSNWSNRIDELIAHHERRLNKLRIWLAENEYCTGYGAVQHIFGNKLSHQPQNFRFAITELIAHLDYFVVTGEAEVLQNEAGIQYYQLKSGKA